MIQNDLACHFRIIDKWIHTFLEYAYEKSVLDVPYHYLKILENEKFPSVICSLHLRIPFKQGMLTALLF